MGKVRFAHFDSQVQSSKKVVLATEKNVFAALNTRTGDLCEYLILSRFMTAENNSACIRQTCFYILFFNLLVYSLATCRQDWARGEH